MRHPIARCEASCLVSLVVAIALATSPVALAQSGGGSGGGGSSGGGSSSGSSSSGGSAAGGAGAGTNASPASPGGAVVGPRIGPGARPSGTPTQQGAPLQRPLPGSNTGANPQLRGTNPDAQNTDANNALESGRRLGTGDPLNDVDGERQPQQDNVIGGSGGSGNANSGAMGADPLDTTGERKTDSISGEPNRVVRSGGAAGADLDGCMKVWDPSTHMTKEQWRTTCERLGR